MTVGIRVHASKRVNDIAEGRGLQGRRQKVEAKSIKGFAVRLRR
jgi:hypothetical protein